MKIKTHSFGVDFSDGVSETTTIKIASCERCKSMFNGNNKITHTKEECDLYLVQRIMES